MRTSQGKSPAGRRVRRPPARRAVALGALAGIAFVVLVAVVGLALGGLAAAGPEHALVMLVCEDEAGVAGAAVVGMVDLAGERTVIDVFDPAAEVLVPGTSGETYFDAYAFGGPRAVAEAHARTEGLEEPLPYVAIPLETAAGLAGEDAFAVECPKDMDVFTGSELVSFPAGETRVAWRDVDALLAGAAYLEPESCRDVNAQVGRALWGLVRSCSRDALRSAVESGAIATDVTASDLARVGVE